MVPDLIWAPDFFSSQEILAPQNLGPNKLGPCIKMPYNDFHAGIKFPGDQISWGPNFSGTKKVRGPNEVGDHFSCSLYLESIRTEPLDVPYSTNKTLVEDFFESLISFSGFRQAGLLSSYLLES